MALDDAAKNAMLDELGTLATFMSIQDAAGSGNEISGGSPAYIRIAISWAAASGGSMSAQATFPVFDVASGDTAAFLGLNSAETAGTWYGEADITDEVFGGQGTYTVTAFTVSIT